ncbi:Dynamitin-domain-containing protein [Lactarius akahatsu]|uniref:Dynamitin-domain-containing protein n=1 Tax=Lactarius akahatsu TaxID=416441 RepID=A0AAD4Q7R1_9AGAM|nr:Dynamitin-domain-containing protein [Lactarius akahatsu]
MSAHKYSNLPDIDSSGKDVYETEDTFQSVRDDNNDSSDDEGLPSRSRKVAEHSAAEGVDESSLVDPTEASKRFRRAERKRTRERSLYKYPPSRTPSPTPTHPPSLALRLKLLQSELTSLESELADPASPLLVRDREQGQVDPGDLLKGLVDVKARLAKFSAGHEGRARLVQDVLRDPPPTDQVAETTPDKNASADGEEAKASHKTPETAKSISEMDRRVGELEKLVGSASTSLDDSSAMPAPLLPLLTRLNTQLTVLAQPRHIDNISRRLKLLLSDLDRLAAANQQHKRGGTAENDGPTNAPAVLPASLQEQLAPALSRLVPALPQIPHILARLRTLATLHTSAAQFANALSALEEEQRQSREALDALTQAIEGVDGSLSENGRVVKGNVAGLEERIDALTTRLDKLGV